MPQRGPNSDVTVYPCTGTLQVTAGFFVFDGDGLGLADRLRLGLGLVLWLGLGLVVRILLRLARWDASARRASSTDPLGVAGRAPDAASSCPVAAYAAPAPPMPRTATADAAITIRRTGRAG
ncbi:hypothetical protein GCM10022220_21570 [Actinocatenispora rupis]|uniref:Uncharacterized protein n=1 Tax=Actinocatenispora rupis TaxID=519421 RepID=A0A8J3IZZ4_9ACTN|nr:hypothetical protein Aru02nite_25820 [Actinocatenispora rupis]